MGRGGCIFDTSDFQLSDMVDFMLTVP